MLLLLLRLLLPLLGRLIRWRVTDYTLIGGRIVVVVAVGVHLLGLLFRFLTA